VAVGNRATRDTTALTIIDPPARGLPSIHGIATLTTRAFQGADLAPLGADLAARTTVGSADAAALLDLASLRLIQGDRAGAEALQARALTTARTYRVIPTDDRAPTLRLLILKSGGDFMANTPVEFLLKGSGVEAMVAYVDDAGRPPRELPPHDVAFVALGESDANQPLLAGLADAARRWPAPLLNWPERIARLSRDGACLDLGGHPGLIVPRVARLAREVIVEAARSGAADIEEIAYPLLVRPVGSHAGIGLEKLDGVDALGRYLAAHDQKTYFVAPFVDYRGADGRFRKARVVLIDGRPYPSHLAVSDHWMIHYLNAGMDQDAGKRAEEARFMETFEDGFARRHEAALAHLHARVGLDYFGIDCGETPDGRLLVFEVDPAMIVHDMDPPDLYPYKSGHMRRLFAAFVDLLERRARR
jgi:glutathione synthase/RimK-type ligase-like ATP-grasp enzyme